MGIFDSLVKATVGVVIQTPVAVVADSLTMFGALTDKKEPYTATAIKNVMHNIESSVKEQK